MRRKKIIRRDVNASVCPHCGKEKNAAHKFCPGNFAYFDTNPVSAQPVNRRYKRDALICVILLITVMSGFSGAAWYVLFYAPQRAYKTAISAYAAQDYSKAADLLCGFKIEHPKRNEGNTAFFQKALVVSVGSQAKKRFAEAGFTSADMTAFAHAAEKLAKFAPNADPAFLLTLTLSDPAGYPEGAAFKDVLDAYVVIYRAVSSYGAGDQMSLELPDPAEFSFGFKKYLDRCDLAKAVERFRAKTQKKKPGK
ncbi:hypothetical protein ACFL6Y_02965 [Elusimicrobiota bacterium]